MPRSKPSFGTLVEGHLVRDECRPFDPPRQMLMVLPGRRERPADCRFTMFAGFYLMIDLTDAERAGLESIGHPLDLVEMFPGDRGAFEIVAMTTDARRLPVVRGNKGRRLGIQEQRYRTSVHRSQLEDAAATVDQRVSFIAAHAIAN